MTLVAPTLQAFFSDRLTRQLQASPRTIASYRDTLRLLLCFVHDTTGTAPSALDWDELDEPVIVAFLEHLERVRGNSARTRNLRLTAIRSLFRYAAARHPEHAPSLPTSGETLTIRDSLTSRARFGACWDVAGQRTREECRRGPVRRASRRRARGIGPRRARRVGVGVGVGA